MSPFLGTRGAGSSKAFDPGAGRPNQVTGLTATDFGTSRAYNDGRIDLSWTAPANNGAPITGYKIERSTDGSTYSTLVSNTGSSATTYSNTGLSSAQIYYYRVSAINAAGTGLASTAANATSTTVPQAPTVTVANVGIGRAYNNGAATVTVTGGATGGKTISSYTATSSPGSFTATSGSPLTVTGLASATAYTFSVTATNANGSSTATVSGSITATTVPQAPTIGTPTAGTDATTQVNVAFTAGATGGSAITSYTATSSPGSLTGTGASSPITVSGLTPTTAYTFTVTATNANGTSSASSASSSITTATPTSFESIASVQGGGSYTSFSFSNIPQTYKNLQIRFYGLGGGTNADYSIRLNGISTGYYNHRLVGNGTSVTNTPLSWSEAFLSLNASNSAAPCVAIVEILDYASTSKTKVMRSYSAYDRNGTGEIYLNSVYIPTTSAITSVALANPTGSNMTFTSMALYGAL